jgi:hypothetical protein
MVQLSMQQADLVNGGGLLSLAADVITVGQAIYDVGSYFAQDNGGPSAADWCASVGYVG